MNQLKQRFEDKLSRNPIKVWRKENGIVKSALALAMSVSLQTLVQYETGGLRLSDERYARLQEITGIEDIKQKMEDWYDGE